MSEHVTSADVVGQKVEAIRYGQFETVIYLENGKQIIVAPVIVSGANNPFAIVRTVIV